MEVKKVNQEKLKKAILEALANLMLEEDFDLNIQNIKELFEEKEKVLTIGGKKNG